MMLKRLLFMGLVLITTASHAAGEGPEAYAATAALQFLPGEGLQRLGLPWAVVEASRSADLADVRAFDSQGQALPFAWARAPSAGRQTRTVQLPVFAWPESATAEPAPVSLHFSANGAVLDLQAGSLPKTTALSSAARTWLIDLSALRSIDERGDSLRLNWQASANGLSAQARLEASEDGQQWRPFAQGRLLEFSAGDAPQAPPRIDSLTWPDAEQLPRYVRLRLDAPLALRDASLSLSHRLAAPNLTQSLRFEAVSDSQQAQWQLDLKGRVAPLALSLQLPEGNALLNLRLEQRNEGNEPWRAVSRFVAWRMQRGGVDGQSPPEPVQASAARYWRIVAEGPPPASLQGQPLTVLWQWQAPQLVLLAQGRPDFVLAVGRGGQRSSAVPLSTLMPGYQADAEFKLPQVQLGALQERPARGLSEQLTAPEPEALRRWALWAVLLGAVIGLAWMARSLLRKIGPPDNS